ncbi:MAG: hypothetical protein ABJF10_00765 [Chthoniobacter sp.]|uniref:hypothetical protein n=1 Tax=Chthoniobacter sp. TaxID=2510640 RepID=UPI0032A6359F
MGVFFVALFASARANPSPLSVEVTPLTLRPRTYAPAYLDLKLHSQSRAPLEGTLEMEMSGGGQVICRSQIPDLTLLFGTSSQRILLPPPVNARVFEEVHLKFSTRTGVHDLGRFPTAGEIPAARQYLIGICRTDFSAAESQTLLWRALRPDRLFRDDAIRVAPLVTGPAWFLPEDLPPSLGLCAFDVIVLEGPALAALSEKQLTDLAIWVEAGGSLCLALPRDLKGEHIAFINRLAASQPGSASFDRAPDGTLVRPIGAVSSSRATSPILFRRAGLGRVAVAFTLPASEGELMTDSWIKATHFLAHSNSWARVLTAEEIARWPFDSSLLGAMQGELVKALPYTARMIPLPVIVTILGVFVLLIGPGEWLILGRLHRRRWTWATFPAIAAGCTFWTVRTAEHYLGIADQRVSMIVTDYSSQGRALRENRFDLWFAGRNQDAVSEKRQALAVPCLVGFSARSIERGIMSVYQGRVPTHYTLREPLSQWTPYVQRSLSLAPAATGPRLRWEAIKVAPPEFENRQKSNEDLSLAEFVTEKIEAQGWTIHVFKPRFPVPERPSFTERISISAQPWVIARSPSGETDLLDLTLDHGGGDMLVVAERHVSQEIQIQRCVYHFSSDE